ncbi:hypothetical protein RJ640_012432 [Escallonia rubra]|uniref:Retrovirus-related Pol polyprotein from transposon TNT 1-94 n=1 Tax=Escallonia rubra TaxID=112253 RepID=A0AA88QLN6_9ASTE|nr:hypothetical protein RJ640_012432 [Escallonia rubra]
MDPFVVESAAARMLLVHKRFSAVKETSPIVLWQKLEKIYMSKSLSNRLYLKKDMYQLRMDECSDLGNHISEFNRLVAQLSSIDVKLKEEDQAILLLSSLPKSYETLKTTLLIGKETLLVDDVLLALMNSSRVNGTSSSSQGKGLVGFKSIEGGGIKERTCHWRREPRYTDTEESSLTRCRRPMDLDWGLEKDVRMDASGSGLRSGH